MIRNNTIIVCDHVVHPVDERHKRIQALIKVTRNIMKRTGIEMYKREEMIDNYIRLHWALSDNTRRDYKKTALLVVQDEIEEKIEKVVKEIPPAKGFDMITALENR